MTSRRTILFATGVLGVLVVCGAAGGGGAGAYDQYGGWTNLKGKKTGFFHIEEIKERTWFVTPEGNAFFSKGVCSVNTEGAKDEIGPKMHGAADEWAKATVERLRSWGLNTAGCWTGPKIGAQGIAWTPHPPLSGTHEQKLPDVFDPAWAKSVQKRAMKECGPLKDDPWVLGYFPDNEINWNGDEKKAKQYFKVVSEAIRAADPNHLILGCRFAGVPPMTVVKEMKGYMDVISINNYGDRPPVGLLKKMHELTGLPVMVTEFSVKAKDSGPLTHAGSGPVVETQRDRAQWFERYVGTLADLHYCVGYHWFRYGDKRGNNQGLVQVDGEPWATLTDQFKKLNPTLDDRHAR